jgi:hypothetical protein
MLVCGRARRGQGRCGSWYQSVHSILQDDKEWREAVKLHEGKHEARYNRDEIHEYYDDVYRDAAAVEFAPLEIYKV